MIAATHRPLEVLVREGKFREDVYFRLCVVELHIPPLRERRGDIADLARHLLAKASRDLHREATLSPDALRALESHRWPGNVRELENALVRALALSAGFVIGEEDLILGSRRPPIAGPGAATNPDDQTLAAAERAHIERVLTACDQNKRRACRVLGVSRPRLDRLLQRHAIEVTHRDH